MLVTVTKAALSQTNIYLSPTDPTDCRDSQGISSFLRICRVDKEAGHMKKQTQMGGPVCDFLVESSE